MNGRVIGTGWVYGDPRKHFPKAGGRFLNPQDEEEKRRVIFLGNELAEEMFGRRGAGRPDAAPEQLAVHRDRGHAAQEPVGDLRGAGRRPRRHPDHDVPGAVRKGAAERPRAPTRSGRGDGGGARAAQPGPGRRAYGFDPQDERALERLEHGRRPAEDGTKILLGMEIFLGDHRRR